MHYGDNKYISRLLKGEENLTLDTLCKLERALNVPIMKKVWPVSVSFFRQGVSVGSAWDFRFGRVTKRNGGGLFGTVFLVGAFANAPR